MDRDCRRHPKDGRPRCSGMGGVSHVTISKPRHKPGANEFVIRDGYDIFLNDPIINLFGRDVLLLASKFKRESFQKISEILDIDMVLRASVEEDFAVSSELFVGRPEGKKKGHIRQEGEPEAVICL